MVKGITRQVIVVQSPEKKLFEQAIFILREDAADITDEKLLQEARNAVKTASAEKHRSLWHCGPLWACGGGLLTGLAWLLSNIL